MTPDVPAMRTTVERSERGVLVSAHGELDLATAPVLQRALRDAVADGPADGPVDLVVDLSGVTFVDATGLGALLRAAEAVRAAGGELRLVAPSRMLRLVLQLLALEADLPVVDAAERG